jgi:hypothetical protein
MRVSSIITFRIAELARARPVISRKLAGREME